METVVKKGKRTFVHSMIFINLYAHLGWKNTFIKVIGNPVEDHTSRNIWVT